MLYCYQEGKHTYFHAHEGQDGPLRLLLHPSQWGPIRGSYGKRPIEVCSTSLVDGCETTEQILTRMQAVTAPPIGGGWRTVKDQEIYALYISRMDALEEMQKPVMRPEVATSLGRHPLIAAGATFAFGSAITLQLITLMQDIHDILRFNDPAHPQRKRRLKSYFRLGGPETIMQLMTGQMPSNVSEVRACMAVQSWKMQPLRELERIELASHPEAFLFRDFWAYYDEAKKHHNEESAHALALWRTTVRFLVYVRQLWLSGIEVEAFKAERFFKRPDEVEAFLKFTKPVDPVVKEVDS